MTRLEETYFGEKEMLLPSGKTCSDCQHFEQKCKWLIGPSIAANSFCDWSPSRFRDLMFTAASARTPASQK